MLIPSSQDTLSPPPPSSPPSPSSLSLWQVQVNLNGIAVYPSLVRESYKQLVKLRGHLDVKIYGNYKATQCPLLFELLEGKKKKN